MKLRIAVQRASWDVMHHKLVTPEFISWLEKLCPGTHIEPVSDEEILRRSLDWFHAVLYPGSVGSALAVQKYGEVYRAIVRDFVRRGGCYIGVCGGCYAAVRSFRLRKATRSALAGALKSPGTLKDAVDDITAFDCDIGGRTGRSAGASMASAIMRGRLKTFDLIDAQAHAPSFVGDPDFIKNRWSKMVTEGRLLEVHVKVAAESHPLTRGHEGETVSSAYSGGPMLDSLGPSVTALATYDSCDMLPDADGKVAVAFARCGDGIVIVSGPDFYIPFQTEPGMRIRAGMEPSVPWLTRNIAAVYDECRRFGRAS